MRLTGECFVKAGVEIINREKQMNTTKFSLAAEYIANADGLLITAGAGMGVDSGLPDFRGTEGFWQAYPALGQAQIAFEEIANPYYFQTDPTLAWGFYGHRLALYRRTQPHAGFGLLREIAANLSHGAFVFTSNVDGQFQKAGFADTQVLECHGSIHWLQCQSPACNEKIWPADEFRPQIDASVGRLRNKPPSCPMCGGVARPNILMFNDWHWVEELAIARKEHLAAWLSKVERLVTIELGAGNAIRTVRRFGGAMDGQLIRINPTDEEIGESQEGVAIRLGALDGLNGIAQALVDLGFLSQENKPRAPLVSVETCQF